MPPRAILLDALGTLLELEPPAPRARRAAARAPRRSRCRAGDAERALRAEMGYYRAQCVRAADAGVARGAAARVRRDPRPRAGRPLRSWRPRSSCRRCWTACGSGRSPTFPQRWSAGEPQAFAWSSPATGTSRCTTCSRRAGCATCSTASRPPPRSARRSPPALFEAALAIAGASAAEAIHVGDSLARGRRGCARRGDRGCLAAPARDGEAPLRPIARRRCAAIATLDALELPA